MATPNIPFANENTGAEQRPKVSNLGELIVKLLTGDIEIGAVEIKDGDSDTRADVKAGEGAENGLVTIPNGTVSVSGVVSTNIATAVSGTNVSVTTSPTLIPPSALANRKAFSIYNNGDKTVFLGHPTVASGTGFPLPAGGAYDGEAKPGVDIYGITTTGQCDIRILEWS